MGEIFPVLSVCGMCSVLGEGCPLCLSIIMPSFSRSSSLWTVFVVKRKVMSDHFFLKILWIILKNKHVIASKILWNVCWEGQITRIFCIICWSCLKAWPVTFLSSCTCCVHAWTALRRMLWGHSVFWQRLKLGVSWTQRGNVTAAVSLLNCEVGLTVKIRNVIACMILKDTGSIKKIWTI